MRITTQGMNLPLILREDGVGASVQKICYPSISSCITITCVGTAGIAGAHLTVLTTAAQLAETIQSLRSSGIGALKVCYVIGAIRHFKTYVKEGAVNTRKKISTALECALGGPSRPLFYDTSSLGEVHVFAERVMESCHFSYCMASSVVVAGQYYPAQVNSHSIAGHLFTSV